MTTIHLILNAHLDPIWLWPWTAGLDAALATCRSACDRLDAHPDLVFCRGEAWVYDQVERLDPALFARLRAHVIAGRWEPVGGWWIQPDCNLPSGFGLARQIALGQEWFRSRFGLAPEVAYNVDSFGHAASLPGYLRAAGQTAYVMMRPQEHELRLPARLFRWRGFAGGPEVTVFRIAGAYTTPGEVSLDHLRRCLTELPAGVTHTMCFIGVGDHGGGPTEAQIAWLREHWHAVDGARLEFSSPARFFAAVAADHDRLPLVVGELQHHAIGCYSVHRPVKTLLRQAEHRLRQAELGLPADPATADRLRDAWRTTCFHQFHDTLGGTCLPSAYEAVHQQLGGAVATADELLQSALRREAALLPPEPLQRLLLWNPSDRPYAGCARLEAWVERHGWQPHWRLLDEQGAAVPYQLVEPEATLAGTLMAALLVPVALPAGGRRLLRIDPGGGPPATTATTLTAAAEGLASPVAAVDLAAGELRLGGLTLPLPRLELLPDPTDTWSHGVDRYPDAPAELATWDAPRLLETGPLRAALIQTGHVGSSALLAEWQLHAGDPAVTLHLRVDWRERQRILKLVLPLSAPLRGRLDGIPGAVLARESDGVERPLRDFTRLDLGEAALGVLCPDVYALDATPARVRFTLLRSPWMAHHDPAPVPRARALAADQGTHAFRFTCTGDQAATIEALEDRAAAAHRPLILATATQGMPAWPAAPKF